MRIAIGWCDLPAYAASCIQRLMTTFPAEYVILSTPGPPTEADDLLRVPIRRIPFDQPIRWRDVGGPVDVFFQPGWRDPAMNALGRECFANGGRVCLFFDTNAIGHGRLAARSLRARLRIRGRFDAALCAGRSGLDAARWIGCNSGQTWMGLLGADPEVFVPSTPFRERPKRIAFVGRLVPIKRCDDLVAAFGLIRHEQPEWELVVVGDGPLANALPHLDGVRYTGQLGSTEVAKELGTCQIAALPSRRDPWPLAVHEAALAGCVLLVSRTVGTARELATALNAVTVPAHGVKSLAAGLAAAIRMAESEGDVASLVSRRLAEAFGPDAFTRAALGIIGGEPANQYRS